jgi:phage gp45-like
MVTRTTLRNASQRAQSYASRATLRELNSKTQWSEAKHIDVFPGETATDVEYAENYGGTSVPAKQDEDEDKQQGQQKQSSGGDSGAGGAGGTPGEENEQPKGDAAEAIVLYLNGSRSHPVIISVGDRRHRLLELEEGDVAQHRLKDDRQQMLYSKDGTYISTRSDKVMRIALVEKQQDDKQQTPAQQQQANGASGAGGGQSGGTQKKKKTMGQKSAKDDNKKSSVAIEQNGSTTYSQHGESYSSQKGGSDSTTHYGKDKKKSGQSTEQHTHIRFQDHRIFNDEEGNWWTSPCLVKKDKYCKEG